MRQDALAALATRTGTSMADALLAAVEPLGDTPGASAAAGDLMRLLADMPTADSRPRSGRRSSVWRATGAVTRCVRARSPRSCASTDRPTRSGPAAGSARLRIGSPARRGRRAGGAGSRQPARRCPAVARDSLHSGTPRHRRSRRSAAATCASCCPGRRSILSLAEVQVFSGGDNVATKGAATQSSTLAGGATGGHAPRANDGGLEPDAGRHRSPKGTRPSRAPNRTPGGSSISAPSGRSTRIALWAASADTRTGCIVSVLDASRSRCSCQDGCGSRRRVPGRYRRRPDDPAADGGDRQASRHARPRSRDACRCWPRW